jgi:hypothetical protein
VRDSLGRFLQGVVCGFGVFNPTDDQRSEPLFRKGEHVWRNMLERCYGESEKSYKYYGGSGVTVSNEWLEFSAFFSWFLDNYKEGLYLDKDILPNPNKVYSKDTCCFVTREVNNRFSKRKKTSDLPEGVHKATYGTKYYASISINNKKTYLSGSIESIWECSRRYLNKKYELIEDMIKRTKSTKVIEGLKYQLYLIEKKIALACCELEREQKCK